jgi:hypothetical protein
MALGEGVARRVREHAAAWTETLTAARPAVEIPLNGSREPMASHGLLGMYYEFLSTGIFGGERIANAFTRRLPDVADLEGRVFTEVKGCCVNKTLQLRDSQVEFYRLIQAAYPDWRINLAIFRHAVPKIKSYAGSDEELYAVLTQKTLYSVVLPFDVMLGLHDGERIPNLVRMYEEEIDPEAGVHTYETCACLRIAALHRFVLEPEAALREMGFSQGEHEVRRTWSPSGMTVNGVPVTPFPTVIITRVDYAGWREQWRRGFSPDPEIFESVDPLEPLAAITPPTATGPEAPF